MNASRKPPKQLAFPFSTLRELSPKFSSLPNGFPGLSGFFFPSLARIEGAQCLRRSSPLRFELRSKRWDSTDLPAHPAFPIRAARDADLPCPAIAVAGSHVIH